MSEAILKLASDKFKPLYEGNFRQYVLVSGRGCAKSWAVADYIVYNTHEYLCRVFCARTVQMSLAQSSWKVIKDSMARLGVLDDYELVESKSTMRCKVTGSEIYFGGIDNDPQKFKSTEGIDIFWYEEAQTVSKEAIEMIIPTIRKEKAVLIWSANPRFENDPFSREFLNNSNRPDTLVIRLQPEDNRFFPEVLRREMEYCKANNYEDYLHIWRGEFASSTSESLLQMSAIRACIGFNPPKQDVQIFAGLDVGATGDPTALYVRQGRKFIGMKEWTEPDHYKLVELVCDELDRYGVHLVMPDATGFGYTFAQMLKKRYGEMRVLPINFAQSASRTGFINKRAEMALAVREAVNGTIQLPSDSALIEELSTVRTWKTASDKYQLEGKNDIRGRLGRSSNWLDAIMLAYATNDRPLLLTSNSINSFKKTILLESAWVGD